MTGADFRTRVEAVHAVHVGGPSRHGALAWFGEWCHRTGRAVFTWTKAKQVPDGAHLVVLALLEVVPPRSPVLRAVRRATGDLVMPEDGRR